MNSMAGVQSQMDEEISEVLVARVPKDTDVETHVRLIMIDGVLTPEVRDYIVSLNKYGRGYWFSNRRSTLQGMIKALTALMDQAEDR